MKIRNKITIRFTFVVIAILGTFSVSIYFLSADYRQEQFFSRLKDRALTTAKLLLDVSEVDSNLLKIIDKNTVVLLEEKVEIYNSDFKKIYCSVEKDFTEVAPKILEEIINKKEFFKETEKKQTLGIIYKADFDDFIIIASANDRFGKSRIQHLRNILLLGMLISIILVMVSGWLFSGLVLKPISGVIKQVENISAKDLSIRVNEGKGKDEIAGLASAFNKMLDRLEQAFEIQKSFVSNASHELRTPLTSITGQIEVTLMNERSIDEYKKILHSIDEDIKNLNQLSNGLLELTYLSMDISNLTLLPTRVDELLWSARSDFIRQTSDNKVIIEFSEIPDKEDDFIILGNEHLLKIAVKNMIENGCKFSKEKTVFIKFKSEDTNIQLSFINSGDIIFSHETQSIFEPFFRASNASNVKGHGLGLSLVKRILEIHDGKINVESGGNLTSFIITMPKYVKN